MSRPRISPAELALQELKPPDLVAAVGNEAGAIPPKDFFLYFSRRIAATLVYTDLQSPELQPAYFGSGSSRRPYPTISDATGMYAETVGTLQDLARVQYPDVAPGLFDATRLDWREEFAAQAAAAGSCLVAAHVIYRGRAGIADALVYPRAVGERVNLWAREALVSGLSHLSEDRRQAAQPVLSGGPELQDATTLLMASVMPAPDVVGVLSRNFYER